MARTCNFVDMEGGHILHEFVDEGDVEKVRALLESQMCNVDETDQSGRSALHLAALRGRLDIVSVLVSGGADVNLRDKQGNTPLHWCGNVDTVELLVDNGANVLVRNKIGLTPRALAQRRGVPPIVLDLLTHRESIVHGQESSWMVTRHGATDSTAYGGTRFSFANEQVHMSNRKQAGGLWQELSCELGVQKSLLFLLVLLGFSFCVAYILTGMHQGMQVRIPVENIER